jgi:hypothetical protein
MREKESLKLEHCWKMYVKERVWWKWCERDEQVMVHYELMIGTVKDPMCR